MANIYLSPLGRAAAILTTGEVAGASFDLEKAQGGAVSVDFSFTLGSLTNVVVRAYVSQDASTWDPIPFDGASVGTPALTLTASTDCCLRPAGGACPGWKWFRISVQGTGTTTSSSCTFTYRAYKRGVG